MKSVFLRNLISVLSATFISLAVSVFLNFFTPLSTPHYWISISYFIILFVLMNMFYAYKRHETSLLPLLLAGIVIRLILSLGFVVVYFVMDVPGLLAFAVHFTIHYVVFTFFEIRYLLLIITPARHE